MKHIKFSIATLLLSVTILNATVEDRNWSLMQQKYVNLVKDLNDSGALKNESQYCHPHWLKTKEKIKQLVLGECRPDFVNNSILSNEMVRRNINTTQHYEICFLKNCTSTKTQNLLSKYQDTDSAYLTRECTEFNCSTNSLGHLFYAARSLEKFKDNNPDVIVEFGGGYGNLGRIFKTMLPQSTILMIDLPELLALQYFFLKSSLDNVEIILHSHIPSEYKKGAIHLLPSYIMSEINIDADLFISSFALSEAPEVLQTMVHEKRFFNADVTYISGQLHGWADLHFVNHSILHNAVRSSYQKTDCNPFHYLLVGLQSYEIIGTNF